MDTSVVIIVAMESERVHLDTLLPGWQPVENTVWPTLRNGDVVCITCGIGMSFAAAATEHAIATYNPTMVMNYGCAGAHSRELFPGDVVIGDRVVHQGRMRIAPDGTMVPLEIGFHVPGETEKITDVRTDATLRAVAEQVAADAAFTAWPESHRVVGQSERVPHVRVGTVSSADIWIQHADQLDAAFARTGSLCEDMESASIAQICAVHGVPFLTVKDISNSEFHQATVFTGSSSELHNSELGLRAATVVVGVIDCLRTVGSLRGPVLS